MMIMKYLWSLVGLNMQDPTVLYTSMHPTPPSVICNPTLPSNSGYAFVTRNITNLDDEINNLDFGVVDYWTTNKTVDSHYAVHVWMHEWTNTELHEHLSVGYTA